MSASLESIWMPVGKKPSTLWQGECMSFNECFLALYDYFKEHECYAFSTMGYNYTDAMSVNFGHLKVLRIGRWLAYYGLLQYDEARVYNEKEKKKQLVHSFKATKKGYGVYQNGTIITIAREEPLQVDVGVGLAYAKFSEVEKWINQQYEANKVAQWRQAKWTSDFHRLYFSLCLTKKREEVISILRKWLGDQLASIPRRRRVAVAKEMAKVDALMETQSKLGERLTDWCNKQ